MSIDTYKKEVGMMNLEKLIAGRESVSVKPFPIPDEELLKRYEQLYTGAISDVLREHVLFDQSLPGHILPLRPERTVAGIAFTVKSAPNVRITGEMACRTQMLTELPKPSFVAWDSSGDQKATLWGGVMTATAVGLGVRAAVIDGGIRDTHQILAKDFPVFYKHRIPNGSLGRCLITHYQIPILIGDVVNLYVADTGNSRILEITPGGVTRTLAGSPAGEPGFIDANGTAARLDRPRGLILDASGTLHVADTGNSALRRISPADEATPLLLSQTTPPATTGTGGGNNNGNDNAGGNNNAGGGGGGAPGAWFFFACAVIAVLRWRPCGGSPSTSGGWPSAASRPKNPGGKCPRPSERPSQESGPPP
jgi:regulator of RNase E activity RraA